MPRHIYNKSLMAVRPAQALLDKVRKALADTSIVRPGLMLAGYDGHPTLQLCARLRTTYDGTPTGSVVISAYSRKPAYGGMPKLYSRSLPVGFHDKQFMNNAMHVFEQARIENRRIASAEMLHDFINDRFPPKAIEAMYSDMEATGREMSYALMSFSDIYFWQDWFSNLGKEKANG